MYGRRRLKVLMDSITDTNPEYVEKASEGNDPESKVSRLSSHSPKSRRECMNGKYLVGCASVHRGAIRVTYKGDQCNS